MTAVAGLIRVSIHPCPLLFHSRSVLKTDLTYGGCWSSGTGCLDCSEFLDFSAKVAGVSELSWNTPPQHVPSWVGGEDLGVIRWLGSRLLSQCKPAELRGLIQNAETIMVPDPRVFRGKSPNLVFISEQCPGRPPLCCIVSRRSWSILVTFVHVA